MAPSSSRPPASLSWRRLSRTGGVAALALAGLSCSDTPLGGPGLRGARASLRMQPRFEARAGVAAAFAVSHVRLQVVRLPDGAAVLDTVIAFTAAGGAAVAVDVPVLSSADRFVLHLDAADASGDTLFRAVDTTTVARGGAVAAEHEVLLRYAGVDAAVTRIAVGPVDTTVAAGAEHTMWAVGYRGAAATSEPLTHVTWSSSDAEAVAVSRTGGRIAARVAGRSAWIVARSATGLVDSTRVSVRAEVARLDVAPAAAAIAVGDTAQLAALGLDAAGDAATGQPIAWSSSNSSVAAVSAAGVVTAVAPGTAQVTATVGAAQATATITVSPAAVAAIVVAPTPAVALTVGQTSALSALPIDARGDAVGGLTPAWATSDAAVVTVTSAGLLTGRAAGSAVVSVTAGGRSAQVPVTVALPPASAVVLSPSGLTLPSDGSATLDAIVTDEDGATVPGVGVTWSSSNAGIATVSAGGRLQAVAAGTATITASANGRVGSATVVVLPAPVASIALTPTAVALTIGEVAGLAATPRDAQGAPLAGRAVAWHSSAPAIVRVDASGLLSALAEGTATIVATSEGRTASATVTVQPVPVASVLVSPADIAVAPGVATQLAATARDAGGSLLAGRAATWRSSDVAVARVAADGSVTAVAPGLAEITAAVDGVEGSAAVRVVAPEERTLRVTPASATVAVGGTLPLAAQAFVGVAPVDATVSWTSRAPGVATVGAAGTVTAAAAGTAWIVGADGTGARDSARVTVVTRERLAFDLASTSLGFRQRWGTGAGAGRVCRETSTPAALPVALASSAPAMLAAPASVTIAAGQRCATFDATAGTTAGTALVLASAPTSGTVEYLPDTLAVAIGTPALRLTLPASALLGTAGLQATVETVDQAGVARMNAEAVPLSFATSNGVLVALPTTSATIAAGAGSATVGLSALGLGTATITASDPRTGNAGRYASDAKPLAVTILGTLSVTPASHGYTVGTTTTAQAIALPAGAASATVRLTSSNPDVAAVPATVTASGAAPGAFAVTAGQTGSAQVTAEAVGYPTRTFTLSVVAPEPSTAFTVEGWGGTYAKGVYLRVRLIRTAGTFAAGERLTVTGSAQLDVFTDRVPAGPAGLTNNGAKGDLLAPGATIDAPAGASALSFVLKTKDPGSATFTLSWPDGQFTTVTLTGMTILPN